MCSKNAGGAIPIPRGVVSATMADYSLYSRYSGTVSMHWPIVWIRASSLHNPVVIL